jgi:NADH:ubiquinone oxidoreductase subunit H
MATIQRRIGPNQVG